MIHIIRNTLGILLGIAFISIGILHFVNPEPFNSIVPSYLGWPEFWNYSSGLLEIILGVGIIISKTRKNAARLLVVLVLLVSLANINMWMNDLPFNGTRMSQTGHLIRALIQCVLIAILLWLGETIGSKPSKPHHDIEPA